MASGVTLHIQPDRVPLFDGVIALVAANRNAGMHSNREHFGEGVRAMKPWPAALLDLFYDPQTSGGLLFFVAAAHAAAALQALTQAGVVAVDIGHAGPPTGSVVELS